MDARGIEERESRGVCQKFDIDMGDVANNVLVVVKHGQRSDAFAVHEKQGILERTVTIDLDDRVTSQIQLFQRTIV